LRLEGSSLAKRLKRTSGITKGDKREVRSLESLLYCPHCQKMVRPHDPGPGQILLDQKQVCSECNNQIPGYVGGVFSREDILGEDILGEKQEDLDA